LNTTTITAALEYSSGDSSLADLVGVLCDDLVMIQA